MDLCKVCGESAAKYRCPRCSVRTCSLPCVRTHKVRTSCSGKRDRTSFVDRDDYDESTMMSDYFMLNELDRAVEAGQRQLEDLSSHSASRRARTNRERLKREAGKRKIRLAYLPSALSRAKRNTSVVRERGTIAWRVEASFGAPAALEAARAEPDFVALERVSENQTVAALKTRALTQAGAATLLAAGYSELAPELLHVWLRADHSPLSPFVRLHEERTLQESLRGSNIIEFPRVVIAREHEVGELASAEPTAKPQGEEQASTTVKSATEIPCPGAGEES